jgi:hypothetical protein
MANHFYQQYSGLFDAPKTFEEYQPHDVYQLPKPVNSEYGDLPRRKRFPNTIKHISSFK